MDAAFRVTPRKAWKDYFYKLGFKFQFPVLQGLLEAGDSEVEKVSRVCKECTALDLECLQWCVLSGDFDRLSICTVANRQYVQIKQVFPEILFTIEHKKNSCLALSTVSLQLLKTMLAHHKYDRKVLSGVLDYAVRKEYMDSVLFLLPLVSVTVSTLLQTLEHEDPTVLQVQQKQEPSKCEMDQFISGCISARKTDLVVNLLQYTGCEPTQEHLRKAGEVRETTLGFFLIDYKVKTKLSTEDREFWLLECCKVGHVELARDLLRAGAKGTAIDSATGRCGLSYQLEHDHASTFNLFSEKQRSQMQYIRDHTGCNALYYPGESMKEYIQMLKVCPKSFLSASNAAGHSLPVVLMMRDKRVALQHVLRAGCAIDHVDRQNRSQLSIACLFGRWADYVPDILPYCRGVQSWTLNAAFLRGPLVTFELMELQYVYKDMLTPSADMPPKDMLQSLFQVCCEEDDIETGLLQPQLRKETCQLDYENTIRTVISYMQTQQQYLHDPTTLRLSVTHEEDILEDLLQLNIEQLCRKKRKVT